ncbi:small VCP/p97-interacting protein isoform X1 [Corvus cornix cornix]|uniref:small VCP/p97-interacting protein isoform X1 n=1 Tax=Corvus cornix cornix TaxID=932674 RepID=UPI001951F274|nr:small VCP/p97-interacting protein isoform X1 [Corvus cornix cornix]
MGQCLPCMGGAVKDVVETPDPVRAHLCALYASSVDFMGEKERSLLHLGEQAFPFPNSKGMFHALCAISPQSGLSEGMEQLNSTFSVGFNCIYVSSCSSGTLVTKNTSFSQAANAGEDDAN